MSVTVRNATVADIDRLVAFGKEAMAGPWTCALNGPTYPDADTLGALLSSPEATRFDVIVGEDAGVIQAFTVVEKANGQIRWLLGDQSRKTAGTAIMAETKRRYPNSWGRVQNPTVRAWAASLIPSMTITGDRIDL